MSEKGKFKVSDFYEEDSGFPDEDAYPEADQYEFYFNSGFKPSDFEHSDPEFGKRYADWIAKQKGA